MFLNDAAIRRIAKKNVHPFDPALVNPASLDLRLGNTIRVPHWYWQPVLWRLAHSLGWPKWTNSLPFETYLLKPHEFVLCCSMEITRIPDDLIAILLSTSTPARKGIEHLHAGFGDPGFGDNSEGGADWTWELVNMAPWPNLLAAGEPLMQLVLAQLVDVPEQAYKYTGRYNEQNGPTIAKEKR